MSRRKVNWVITFMISPIPFTFYRSSNVRKRLESNKLPLELLYYYFISYIHIVKLRLQSTFGARISTTVSRSNILCRLSLTSRVSSSSLSYKMYYAHPQRLCCKMSVFIVQYAILYKTWNAYSISWAEHKHISETIPHNIQWKTEHTSLIRICIFRTQIN